MLIVRVGQNYKEEMGRFVDFPLKLYAGDCDYVPMFENTIYSYFDRKTNPFYLYGDSACFVALSSDNETLGRVAAFVNPGMNRDGRSVGTIGFYECEQDSNVSSMLLSSAVEWLQKAGCNDIYGPMDFSIWNSYRFKTSGFENGTYYGEPNNRTYYPEQFISFGFREHARWYSREILLEKLPDLFETKYQKYKKRYEKILRKGYEFSHNDPRNYEKEIREVYELILDSYSGFTGFYRISAEEFEYLNENLKRIVETGQIIYAKRNEILHGVLVQYFDLSGTIRARKGKSGVMPAIKHLLPRENDTLICPFFAVSRESIKSADKLGSALIYLSYRNAIENGVSRKVHSLMSEENISGSFSEGVGRVIGTYALYRLS